MKRSRRKSTSDPATPGIEGFEDLEEIGSGGFSRVYRARETAIGRRVVAIKVLNTGVTSEAERRAFENECSAMGLVSDHPNVVDIYRTTFTTDGRPCIVLPFYPNKSAHDRMKSGGRFEVAEVLDIAVKMAGALQSAHNSGLAHRDIKPQNILMSKYDEPVLGDFGISTFEDERTRTGDAGGGTLSYASPETARGDAETRPDKADLYSLGATVYALIAGHGPFSAPGQSRELGALFHRILYEAPPALSRADVPPSLQRLLQSTLAKEAAMRPNGPEAFGRAIQAIQTEVGLQPTQLHIDQPTAGTVTESTTRRGSDGWVAPDPHRPSPPHREEPNSSTVTIPRPKPGQPETEPLEQEPDHAAPRRRQIVGWASAALATAVLLVAVTALGSNDDGPTQSTQQPSTTADDGFFSFVSTPANMTVERADNGTVVVSWDEVENASFYEVRRRDAGAETSSLRSDEPRIELDVGAADTPCVEVVAIGDSGRISQPTDVVCLD